MPQKVPGKLKHQKPSLYHEVEPEIKRLKINRHLHRPIWLPNVQLREMLFLEKFYLRTQLPSRVNANLKEETAQTAKCSAKNLQVRRETSARLSKNCPEYVQTVADYETS